MIDKPILEVLTFGQNPFLNVLDTFFLILGPRSHNAHPLNLISGPCSIEMMYPREWRISIPASLMRVDEFGCVLSASWPPEQQQKTELSGCLLGNSAQGTMLLLEIGR